MTAKWPSSCWHAGSSIVLSRHTLPRVAIQHQHKVIRCYASAPRQIAKRPDLATARAIETKYAANAALTWVQSGVKGDNLNPPRSTLPPPLALPDRDNGQIFFYYWFNVGRAYGTFYKEGIKGVWYNYKAASLLKERIKNDGGGAQQAAIRGVLTRAEWQLLARNTYDIGKLPLFGLLVLLFGEWLPLLVPFMPGVVPGTCRIPQQIKGMRMKAEERRRVSFRAGNFSPEEKQIVFAEKQSWPMTDKEYIQTILAPLRDDQLHHLSSSLTLHSSLWDRVQLSPLRFLMRRNLTKHLQYLAIDDKLLTPHIKSQSPSLSSPELERACEERGLDVLGRPEAVLRENLVWWLRGQQEDQGSGKAMMGMLFRRPAAWIPEK
ncbi:hypothetical protein LTR62_008120 [Meristemomyces frigidus]|uniref:Letm1 RBD domain-containing protein n=1 Tax=Meristemomyces frigidus TaxID=1508187 RepID=A0AAN7YHE4_9PEZI|nr:hypothetical protein LTR62_008120 [Meristemomyces frigidus]